MFIWGRRIAALSHDDEGVRIAHDPQGVERRTQMWLRVAADHLEEAQCATAAARRSSMANGSE
ncbi:hypothetical protein Pth03_74100 [Planotetraspora thailandica]|uniref:Uncharacterized protein n=1 Tax=Planotetraspora thailandica TaxID=487172 RepID=A0A8J3Y1H5_9ACTN|nr:hypothetical protein Pth03_74100 [Planotetraspora thailandica]